MHNLSISEENHIKEIYHLQQQSGIAGTSRLALQLNTKPASVTDMLKKLEGKKMLQYERYKGFRLTEPGNKKALAIIRRHRLWEFFLSTKLGFEWDKIHEIAEQLEHIQSPELVDRLDDFLGNPVIDPHGDPIPGRNGKLPIIKQISLAEAKTGISLVVSAVQNPTSAMMEILTHYHISIGTKLKIIRKFAFDHSAEIKLSQQNSCILSNSVAQNIFVYDGK